MVGRSPAGAVASSERLAFLRAYLRDIRAVGSVTPSSAGVSRAMARLAGADASTSVAELGAGTGPITRALLDLMPPGGRLWSFEIDPGLAAGLRARFDDPRLTVVQQSAAEAPRVARQAGIERFDAIVSAIPYSLLPKPLTIELLVAARQSLRPGGSMVLIQYRPRYLVPAIEKVFGHFERRFYPWNLPPAYLFRVRAPR